MTRPQEPGLAGLVRQLLVAGGPAEWPANVPWPLHHAVAEHCGVLCPEIEPVPVPGTGWSVPGLEDAVLELARVGRLRCRDEGFVRWWVVDDLDPREDRRELLRCDPLVAQQVYRAARRWAALTAVSAKAVRSAPASSIEMSRSGTPIRRQRLVPTL